jgi:transposase-like protein
MDREAARIRGLVRAAGPRGRRARLPDEVRRDLIAFARGRRGEGVGVRQIAAATGVSPESIRRWTARGEPRSTAGELVAVDVVAEAVPIGTLSVRSPSGYRIDVLTLEQAVVALGRLG